LYNSKYGLYLPVSDDDCENFVPWAALVDGDRDSDSAGGVLRNRVHQKGRSGRLKFWVLGALGHLGGREERRARSFAASFQQILSHLKNITATSKIT